MNRVSMSQLMHAVIALIVVFTCATPGFAQREDDRAEDARKKAQREVEDRLEARYPQLLRQQNSGAIGETWLGFVEAVNPEEKDKDVRELVEQENKDRRELYRLIAERVVPGREQVPADRVGLRNGKRKFDKAKPDHFLMMPDGRWIQKSDEERYQRVSKLKADGKVGEVWDGYLAVVETADRDAAQLVDQDNQARRKFYERLAKDAEASIDDIARKAGEQTLKHIAPGEYYKPRNGDWQRRPPEKNQ